ncbi:MAG: putative porin [Bacteroidaceae bacterium]|nr:putative porin [Bacteroidaceae bacterium]
MKRRLLTYMWLFVACCATLQAQNPFGNTRDANGNQIDPNMQPDDFRNDSTEVQSAAPKLFQWRISETLGNQIMTEVDTVALNFQNVNMEEGMTGHYSILGNMGSPRLSHIFADRQYDIAPTIFLQPLTGFFKRSDEMVFTNSNIPYTNLSYWPNGDKITGEDRFKAYFSMNMNRRLAFGFKFDYQYGRGYYANQATSNFNAGLFVSYLGKHYQLHAMYNNYYFKQNENGGITDDEYITNPEGKAEGSKTYESNNIPVRLEGSSNRNHNMSVYLSHRYRLGFTRETIELVDKQEDEATVRRRNRIAQTRERADIASQDSLQNDSLAITPKDTIIKEEFVPVTSFIHTLKVERSRHSFFSSDLDSLPPALLNTKETADSTVRFSIKNVFGISLLEGFNKYAKAGLTAYISHEFNKYTLMNMDTSLENPHNVRYTEQELFVGGELAKREGNLLHYNINGEFGLAGVAQGQFKLDATADLNVKLFKDTVSLKVHGYVKNVLPSFYMRHYHSNHYVWDYEDMDKELRMRLEGELNFPLTGTNLKAGLETIKNYTYFDSEAISRQASGSIKVANATLTQKFKLGILHLDNEVTWQKTNSDLLPLPTWTLYHNLYILTKIAKKVLNVQLGADVRYFSEYYAPTYAPGLQQFHLQSEEGRMKIGNYPVVNVYANLQLKRTRFFVMFYHVNEGMGSRKYFYAPHYPINPRLLKFGVSWNFYD